ncbi:MAG: response regulator [Chitinophagaceae bacterium]|nr:MAG: response regulator [Chitinophagaceae bacterium]
MNTCKILVIDDDEDDVEILVNAFLQSGVAAIQYVKTAMEAFIFLQSVEHANLPKLIVTDNFLPGISGKEFLADLKRMEKYRHIPVVVLSTSKNYEEVVAFEKMGILDYLEKPSSYEEYVKVAEQIRSKALI